jgi:hypothetical protein
MIQRPGGLAPFRVLATIAIDLSKLRTPSMGDEARRSRSMEGMSSIAQIRASTATNTNPRPAPSFDSHAERNTPIFRFKDPRIRA